MDILSSAHKTFLIELINAEVNFLLIGGYAVNYHGYPRFTADMDIWLQPDNINKQKFACFIQSKQFLQEGVQRILSLDFTAANSFHIGQDANRIDFLTHISGVNYPEAEKQKVFLPLLSKQVPVIHYHHLIINKIKSARPKDMLDVGELQKINQYKKNPE